MITLPIDVHCIVSDQEKHLEPLLLYEGHLNRFCRSFPFGLHSEDR